MKYGARKAETFAVVTCVEKHRAYLGSEPFKLRVDNRALKWLKTYSMDQSYIGIWIVRLDGYNMIIEHRTRNNHQNADNLSKKTEFYERQEQREADRLEIKDGFSFMDKETYKKSGNFVMCYVDDVVIATPTLEDHIERLDEVFACMKRAGLKCKPSKCEILKDLIKYLGRMVDKHGIIPDPDAVEAVLTWNMPKTEHQLMNFLGFANYYKEF